MEEMTPHVQVGGHEIGRHKSGWWHQFYIRRPDGRVGLIDDQDWVDANAPEAFEWITPEHVPDLLELVWEYVKY